VIIQSPLLDTGFTIPIWKRAGAALLSVCRPQMSLAMDLNVKWLSHDPVVGRAYQEDPLVHNHMSAGTYRAILKCRDESLRRALEIHTPVLLLLAEQDQIISLPSANAWFERLQCQKRRVVFPNSYHELHHEPARIDVLRLVQEWTLGHASA
jgi:alpha-beta hydrolase superfamily lysophospholipase